MPSMYEISPHGIFPLLIALHDMPQSLESVSMCVVYTKVVRHVHPKKVIWLSNYM